MAASVDLKHDKQEMADSLNLAEPGKGDRYLDFMKLSEQLHGISDRFFFWRSIGGIGDTFNFSGSFNSAVLKDVMRMRMGSTVGGTIRSFINDPNIAQMMDHMVQYVGSSPDASPAILCSIGDMQAQEGIWYPIGGTRAVPEALVKLGKELGVRYNTSTEIDKIVIHDG